MYIKKDFKKLYITKNYTHQNTLILFNILGKLPEIYQNRLHESKTEKMLKITSFSKKETRIPICRHCCKK